MIPTFASGVNPVPEILHFSYGGKSVNPLLLEVDEQSIVDDFELEIFAHTEDQQAKVDMHITNKDTGDESVIFAEQWLQNGQINRGSLELAKGEWLMKISLIDSSGKKSSHEYTIIVTDKDYTGFEIIEVDPVPLYVTQKEDSGVVTVTVENKLNRGRSAIVAWRWADEDEWRDEIEVEFGSVYGFDGKQTMTFTIPKEFEIGSRDFIVSVNPHTDVADRGKMDKFVQMIEKMADLEVESMIFKGQSGSQINVEFIFKHNDQYGSVEDITTDYIYGINGTQTGSGSFTLVPAEIRTISNVKLPVPTNATKIEVFGNINPSHTKPSAEYDFDNNIKILQIDFTKTINLYAKYISGGIFRQGDQVHTEVIVGHSEDSIILSGPVEVVLRKDGQEIASREIYLDPGEERTIFFEWQAPRDPDNRRIEVELEAEINPQPRKYEETTYDDNIVRSRVTLIPTFNTDLLCPPNATVQTALSGLEDRVCCPPPEEEGPCWVCGPDRYYEGFTVSLSPPSKEKVKAGMGFSFEVETKYFNEYGRKAYYDEYNPKYGEYESNRPYDGQAYYPKGEKYDFRRVVAEFPDLDKSELVPLDSPFSYPTKENKWYLPRALIKRGQGDMEMIEYIETLSPIKNVNDETHIDGGNVNYTSLYMPDGLYPYNVYGLKGGVDRIVHYEIPDPYSPGSYVIHSEFEPRLKFCLEDSVTIEGSPHDDYIVRRIDPNVPFPQGGRHGWNWAGYVHTIENIADWWSNYGRGNYNIGQEKMIVDLKNKVELK